MSDWLFEAGVRRFGRAAELYQHALRLEMYGYWFDAKFYQLAADIHFAIGDALGWLACRIGDDQ